MLLACVLRALTVAAKMKILLFFRVLLLWPFAQLYGLGVWLRNYAYKKGYFETQKFAIPTIVIGNLIAGGSGKTPHAAWLLAQLLQAGLHPALLSRGYGRATKGFVLASKQSSAAQIGDEPLMIYQRFAQQQPTSPLPVAVCEQRTEGITQLLQHYPNLNAIVLDDAYQHRALEAHLYVLLTQYNRLFTADYLLPAGNLREPACAANRAQAVIVTKCPKNLSQHNKQKIIQQLTPFLKQRQPVFFTRYVYGQPYALHPSLNNNNNQPVFKGWHNYQAILLVCGIAQPKPLLQYLQSQLRLKNKQGQQVFIRFFADHHVYTSANFAQIAHFCHKWQLNNPKNQQIAVVTTQKDAVKWQEATWPQGFNCPVWVQPIDLLFDDEQEAGQLTEMVLNCIRKANY